MKKKLKEEKSERVLWYINSPDPSQKIPEAKLNFIFSSASSSTRNKVAILAILPQQWPYQWELSLQRGSSRKTPDKSIQKIKLKNTHAVCKD